MYLRKLAGNAQTDRRFMFMKKFDARGLSPAPGLYSCI